MLGSSCSTCCGCSLETLQQIYDTIVSSGCSITLSGTAVNNEAAALAGTDKWCRSDNVINGLSPQTLSYVQNLYGANGENVLTERYRSGENPIGTFEMALVPGDSRRPPLSDSRATFRYEGVLLRIEVVFQLSQLPSLSSLWWPDTKCGVPRFARVDVWQQVANSYGGVAVDFLGPDTIPSAGGFSYPIERSFGYVKSDIPGGLWGSDLGQNWDGQPIQSGQIIYNAETAGATSYLNSKYEITFPKQTRQLITYGWTSGPPTPYEFSYAWQYTGIAARANPCSVSLVGSQPSTAFVRVRNTNAEITPTVTLTPPAP